MYISLIPWEGEGVRVRVRVRVWVGVGVGVWGGIPENVW